MLDGSVPVFTAYDGAVDLFVGIRQRDEARGIAAVLEQECAVLTATLELLTHEHAPFDHRPDYCRTCTFRVDDPRHRTPAFLRKRYGFGA